jgi:hypothetical protein
MRREYVDIARSSRLRGVAKLWEDEGPICRFRDLAVTRCSPSAKMSGLRSASKYPPPALGRPARPGRLVIFARHHPAWRRSRPLASRRKEPTVPSGVCFKQGRCSGAMMVGLVLASAVCFAGAPPSEKRMTAPSGDQFRRRPHDVAAKAFAQRPLPRVRRSGIESRQAPVAQLDRALPSEGKGRVFESRRARHG